MSIMKHKGRVFLAGVFLMSGCPFAVGGETGEAGQAGFQGFEVSGNLMYFQRHRTRYRMDEARFETNLHHQTLQSDLNIQSPYFADTLGFDLGVFATTDLYNSGSPDHEISFFPWDDPWSADWSLEKARGGMSLYRAHLKFRDEKRAWWGKLGYFQPTGPGVLGVNWSLMPGTYLGTEFGGDFANLSIAGAYATQYKAPWYKETYPFFKADGITKASHLWSLGARYQLTPAFSAEAAYGESQGFLQSAHVKLKYQKEEREKSSLYLTYQLYIMGEQDRSDRPDRLYANGWAFQHYLALSRAFYPYTFKTEFLHTRAPSAREEHVGYFVYRLSDAYGGANGAYEPWWDNRSDWNHNRESAVFISLSRTLDDVLGVSGVTAGLSAASGWGGRVYGVEERLRENAWSLDLTWRFSSGLFKNAKASLHYTHYRNQTDQPSWSGFKNLFQSERDVKFLMVMPWKL